MRSRVDVLSHESDGELHKVFNVTCKLERFEWSRLELTLLQLAVSFWSFLRTACVWQENKQGSYQKIQMHFLFTESNYKLDWPRLSPAACVFIHQPRAKCCRCDVVFICLFNTKAWPPGSDLMALPIPRNCDENIVMIKCQVNLNWLQKVDLQKMEHKCCNGFLSEQHCPDCHSFTYCAQLLTVKSLESYGCAQLVVVGKLLNLSQSLSSSDKVLSELFLFTD